LSEQAIQPPAEKAADFREQRRRANVTSTIRTAIGIAAPFVFLPSQVQIGPCANKPEEKRRTACQKYRVPKSHS